LNWFGGKRTLVADQLQDSGGRERLANAFNPYSGMMWSTEGILGFRLTHKPQKALNLAKNKRCLL
jgi:hypothetical protein